ncbi:MAG TPA: radical SAM protein [Firmicutes bacterium]|nr:radical SAM protein [Bacillota bacterium]
MQRFADKDIAIILGKTNGFLYDAISNTIFKLELSAAEKIQTILNNPKSKEYEDFQEYLENILKNKPVSMLQHTDCFKTKHLKKLTIMTATNCNLRCKYCYANYGSYSDYLPQLLTENNAVNYLDTILNYFEEIDQIKFFGGEPLLGIKAIEAICDKMKEWHDCGRIKKVPEYTIITNLTLLDKKMLKIIERNNIHLTVSLDGPPDVNDVLRVDENGNGTYDKVSENIKLCHHYITGIEATYTRIHEKLGWTMEGLQNFLANKFELQSGIVYVCPAIGSDNTICFPPEKIEFGNMGVAGINLGNARILYALKSENQCDLLCTAGFSGLTIMPNGDLYPCHLYALDRNYCMGTFDVNSKSYLNLEQKVKNVRHNMKVINKLEHEECRNCWARNLCYRCPADSLIFLEDKSLSFECGVRKEMMKKSLAMGLESLLPTN